MKKLMTTALFLLLGTQMNAMAATAGNVAGGGYYMGGGLSSNSLSGFDDATGYQIFGGYILPYQGGGATHSVEFGYMDTGDFETSFQTINLLDPFGPPLTVDVEENVTGLWATYTFNMPLSASVNLLARGGLDFGDDDGLMVGVGFEFDFDAAFKLRTELVQRDNVDSLQLNIVVPL